MGRAPKGQVETYQVGHRVLNLKIDGTAGTILQGSGEATLTKNGTGDYTIAPRNPARRLLGVSVGLVTAALRHEIDSASDGTAINVLLFDYDAATAADGTFYVTIHLSHNSRDL